MVRKEVGKNTLPSTSIFQEMEMAQKLLATKGISTRK